MEYRVRWRDGSTTENVDYDESMQLIKDRPDEWAGVQPMNYGQDLDPANEIRRKQWVK